jgi:hypothetical protein
MIQAWSGDARNVGDLYTSSATKLGVVSRGHKREHVEMRSKVSVVTVIPLATRHLRQPNKLHESGTLQWVIGFPFRTTWWSFTQLTRCSGNVSFEMKNHLKVQILRAHMLLDDLEELCATL